MLNDDKPRPARSGVVGMGLDRAVARAQAGFTLVEIAIVLVIVGLLLGGILKGQEMINSARARNLADLTNDIPAAYFGFIDRFNRVPGDWDAAAASVALGATVDSGGVIGRGGNNGRIDNPAGADAFVEPNAVWEQLAKAGFIDGAYSGDPAVPTTNGNQTPLNAFNNVVILGRTADYQDSGTPSTRLHLILGRGVPVDIARETDVKLDDGRPLTGTVRLAVNDSSPNTFGMLGSTDARCLDTGSSEYNVTGDSQDCNLVYLY